MRPARWGALCAALFLISGCGSANRTPDASAPSDSMSGPTVATEKPTRVPSRSPSPKQETTPVVTSPGTGAASPSLAPVDKLLVFMVENHSLDQMRADMPFTYGLAEQYGYARHYQAITHPSLPNYLAIAGGTTYGVTDDAPPSVNGVHGPSVFGQALEVGATAGLYAEGMEGNCATTDTGTRYAVKHNPWAYYLDERSACERYDVPITHLAADVTAGRLPNVGMVIPDLCHDAHDCDLGTADAWLRDQFSLVTSGPDWASGRLAVVITADEDDHLQDNLVLTVLAHPGLHGVVVDEPLNHYSLTRSYAEVLGAAPLGEAAGTPSLLGQFGTGPGG